MHPKNEAYDRAAFIYHQVKNMPSTWGIETIIAALAQEYRRGQDDQLAIEKRNKEI